MPEAGDRPDLARRRSRPLVVRRSDRVASRESRSQHTPDPRTRTVADLEIETFDPHAVIFPQLWPAP